MWDFSQPGVTFDNPGFTFDGGTPGAGGFPDLIGLELYDAIEVLQMLGFYVPASIGYFGKFPIKVSWQADSGEPGGTVLGQVPAAFTANVPPNSPMILAVAQYAVSVAFGDEMPAFLTIPPPIPPPPPPLTLPGAPESVMVQGGNTTLIVSFSPPSTTGGTPIVSYTVTAVSAPTWDFSDAFVTFDNPDFTFAASSGSTVTAAGASSPITVTGLTNGQVYTVTVTATNAVGTGPASSPPATGIPFTVPGAPTGVSATAGNASAIVAFGPAASNGSPVTSYVVTGTGGVTASGTSSPITVSNLFNGSSYSFTVQAINAAGAGPSSGASNVITPTAPLSVPGAPTGLIGTPLNASISFAFTAPSNTGGSAILSYTVTLSNGATASAAGPPITVAGLTNGTAYTGTVRATNAQGTGPASAASVAVTPFTVPAAPIAVTATAGNGQATVTFTAPANNGSPITQYKAVSNPGGITATGTGTSLTVTGLNNGTAYNFYVVATNAAGAGPASAYSNTVTPVAVPGAPTAVAATPGNAQVTVTFTAPSNTGGSAITGYTATTSSGHSVNGPSSPLTIPGLTNGVAVTVTVYATNAQGNGPLSAPSSSVTPFTVPGAATGVSATPGNADMTVSFTAAANNGSPITNYTATAYIGGIATGFTATGSGSPLTITGLTNGTTYTAEVVATNAAGAGPSSNPSNAVTPSSSAAFGVLTPRQLPNAAVGAGYSHAFTLSGGTAPYSATILNASSSLLSSSAAVAPTPANSFSFTGTTLNGTIAGTEIDYLQIKCSDSAGHSVTQIYAINASTSTNPLIIATPISLGDIVNGNVYNAASPLATLTCVGNISAPFWSLTSQTGTNAWSVNSSTGAITGTATNNETDSLNVSVTDGTHTATLTLYVTVNPSLTGTRPGYNTGSGFYVLNARIYDGANNLVRIRGLDECHPGAASAASYVAMGANTVRVFNPTSVSQVTSHIAAGTVPVPVAAYTSGGTATSCSASVPVLASVVQTWISSYSSYSPYQNQFILNIANEWGPDTLSTWANAFTAVFGNITAVSGNTLTVNTVSSTNPFANCPFAYITGGGGIAGQFVTISSTGGSSGAWTVTMSAPITGSYTSGGVLNGGAVGALRGAGYTCPLMIDCNGCGQNNVAITSNANAIFQSDPQKNLIFSLHIYGSIPTADVASVVDGIQAAAITYGFAVAVMEFGPGRNFGPSPTFTTPYQVITACEANGVGWASWAADANNLSGEGSNDNSYSMLYFPYNPIQPTNYTAYGKQVCVDPIYGLVANATVIASP